MDVSEKNDNVIPDAATTNCDEALQTTNLHNNPAVRLHLLKNLRKVSCFTVLVSV